MSKRLQQLASDFEAAKTRFVVDSSPFRDLSLDGNCISLRVYLQGGSSQDVSIDCTDYPLITIFFGDSIIQHDEGLISGWTKLDQALRKTYTLIPGPPLKSPSLKTSGNRSHLRSSAKSNASSELSEDMEVSEFSDEDYGDDDYDELRASTGSFGSAMDDDLNEDRWQESENLMRDLSNYKFVYGDEAIRVKGMPMLEMVEVDMYIWPTEVLSAGTARAWGVDPTAKIGVRVGFSDSHYTNTHKPPSTLEVFQLIDGKRTKFGLSAQLESCLRNFLREQWDLFNAMTVVTLKEKAFVGRAFPPNTPVQPASPNPASGDIDMNKLQNLVDMGFPQEMALDALLAHKNDLDSATAFLLGDDAVRSSPSKPAPQQPEKAKPADATDLIMNPHKALKSGKHGNVSVSGEYGPLVMIAEYVRRRIPQLNNFCVICDKPHVFATGNMLKPAVCSRELCIWSFQQLRVGADSADDIATEAETVDLLICMCAQAAKSSRKELILEPFPSVFHPDQPDTPAISDKNKNFELVNKILAAMPSVEHMVQAEDFGSLKQRMDSAHPLAFPMLQWIISSNRSHIVRLKKEKLVESMKTPHQYLLLSAPPEREARFRDLKAKHGSVFAFHGSGIENWHSILRRGLFNASGTKLMTAGAAYGSGIYLSPDAAVSFGYSRMGYYAPQPTATKAVAGSHNRFLSSNNVWCIAVCEVIDHEIRRNSNIWVQPHEDHVVTRFFFVYTETQNTGNNCSTSSPEFRKELQSAIDFYSFSKAEAEAAADEPGHKMMT